MKCVRCGANNLGFQRGANKGRCRSCRHAFTFDPQVLAVRFGRQAAFSDRFFAGLLKRITAGDKLFFTERQLYYFLNRQLNLKPFGKYGWLTGIAAMIVGGYATIKLGRELNLDGDVVLLLIVAVMIFSIILGVAVRHGGWAKRKYLEFCTRRFPIADPYAVGRLLAEWKKRNGPVKRLLPPPPTDLRKAKILPEIAAYSFDRLVVTDRPTIAHFLIANNFHFENNCAVLCIDRYPYNLFDTVMTMLRRNPDLKVYALHDASPAGVSVVHRLRTAKEWFQSTPNVTIFDLGLLPRHVENKPFPVRQSTESAEKAKGLSEPVRAGLKPEEIRRLGEGDFVELESIAPEVLLRIVTRAVARSRAARESDDGDLMVLDADSEVFLDQATAYTFDSFG